MPPAPGELEAFAASEDPEKRRGLVAEVLGRDGEYAAHWMTFWNDLLRNDYTGTGFITGGRKQITTWLYASLRENKPFDQFVRELIAPTGESSGFIDGINHLNFKGQHVIIFQVMDPDEPRLGPRPNPPVGVHRKCPKPFRCLKPSRLRK